MIRPGFVHLDSLVDFHFGLPVVMNADPEPGATSVEVDSLILFEVYYATGGASPDMATVVATVNGVSAVAGGVIQPGFAGPRSFVFPYTANRVLFILDPEGLPGLASYTVAVQFQGTDAAPCSASWDFSTEDANGPVLVSVEPLGRKTLRVQYAQDVVSDPSAVSVAFPWGSESLALSGGFWRLAPISYPWVKATKAGGYNLSAGLLLHVEVDGVASTVAIPWATTDEITTAAALAAALAPVGAGCVARNGFAWLYSLNQTGSLKVEAGGANTLLLCETGVQTARLAFGTLPGTYTLTATATQPSGVVSSRVFSRELSHEVPEFVLYQEGEEFDSSVLESGNYWLTVDEADCKARRKPAFVPAVESVELGEGESVVLTLEQAQTPGAKYTLHVRDVQDAFGNVIDPNPSSVEFVGFSPVVDARRNVRLYEFFPEYIRQQDANREFQFATVCAVFQEVLDQLFSDLDDFLVSKNPATAPMVVVDRLLEMYGSQFEFLGMDAAKRRTLLELLVDFHKLRGTEAGIAAVLRFVFGFVTLDFIYYWGHGWLLGVPGRTNLGLTTILNTGILARRFSFSIAVDRVLSDEERTQVRQIVERMKTGHTHFIEIEEPVSPFVPDHWQLPWSELGVNTILH